MAMDYKKTYSDKLKDPRWQKRRLEILSRDKWTCQECFDKTSTLHVHHLKYEKKTEPWDYPESYLLTLCETCHYNVDKYRPQLEAEIIDALKLSLKDEFILRCFRDLILYREPFDEFIFLLWQADQNEIMGTMEKIYKEKLESDPDNSNHCLACGSKEMKTFPKYKHKTCMVCGLSVSYNLN